MSNTVEQMEKLFGPIEERRVFELHIDAGHGWLKVRRTEIPFHILTTTTRYSYQSTDREWVYLEEDCDINPFLETLDKDSYGVMEVHDGDRSSIRNLPNFVL